VPDSGSLVDLKLDEALEETFPASDPPADTVETDIRIGGLPATVGVLVMDNNARKRFEISVNGKPRFFCTTGRTMP
jgi:hypothetical protein